MDPELQTEEKELREEEIERLAEEQFQRELKSGTRETPESQKQPKGFPSPFGGKIGNSSIDLSKPGANDAMLKEYNAYWNMDRRDPNREGLREAFHNKYYGMGWDQFNEAKKDYIWKESGPLARLQDHYETLSIPGMAWADFASDALGTVIPGMDKVDERWDEATEFDNPAKQTVREILSVVLPAIYSGKLLASKLGALPKGMPAVQKAMIGTGAFGAQEVAIIGLSDQGEEHNALRVLSDAVPGIFGEKGRIPIPDALKTLDSDSPAVRKRKNMYDTAGLSVIGSIIGAGITILGKKQVLDWLQPASEAAAKYKQLNLLNEAVPEKLIRMQEINEVLSTKKLSRQNEDILINELENLRLELGIVDDVDEAVRKDSMRRLGEQDSAAKRKVATETAEQGDLFDPDLYPGILDESGEARQTVPPANVARNMADTTAIKQGVSQGDPAPLITEAMREKGLMVGSRSRDAVMGVAEETRDIGRFNAIVDGFRFSNKQMNAAAWDIYTSIVDPSVSVDDVRRLFLENRDVKNLLMGRFKVEVINEEQARAAAFAMRDLVDRFLGREVSEASARAMDTLGREAATLAEAVQTMNPYVDDNRAMDLIIDKMQFLMDEYALNKYISGWQLRNKNWFDQVPPKELDTVIDQLTKEFTSAENAIHAKNKRFTDTLKRLKTENPLAMRPLVDAYAHTNGDVDSLAKLQTWAAQQVTPLGMIKSPNPKQMNLFARSAWSVIYNNVLSGLSAFRAGVGNTAQLILKPITSVLGHGFYGVADDFEGLKRTFYANGAMFETNRRALHDAYQMMKKAHKDPEMMIKAYRRDFVFQEDKAWNIMEDMRLVWEAEGNYGKILQYDVARGLKQLGAHPAMRYGMTGMVFPDVFTSTHLAHYLSRIRAYDDVFSEFGFADWSKIKIAEAEHYKKFFDKDGLINDDVLKAVAGEVQLNLDDGLANWINQGTTAYPATKFMLMFPRTSSNYIKNSLSWTPISLIPGINKYSKTIYARTDEQIAAALLEHGIDMATTPNARVIWQNLRAEYTGRIIFSGMLSSALFNYAMAGNIRGNGHYNASRRSKERDQFGYEPKTINLGGKWVSYKGILGVEQVLSIIGDMSYYAKDLNESTLSNWHAKLAWSISASFLNETPLQGLEPLIAATNGDLSGWNRLVANSLRSTLPLSGGAGVVAKAISSSQKDLEGEILEYVQNRTPILSGYLPEQIDIWTGKPLNDIDNPFLKILNAISPVQISGTREPWRVWLLETGWSGISMLKKDSTGSITWSSKEREQINRLIGAQQMYKKLERLMKSKKYAKDLEQLRVHRNNNAELDPAMVKLQMQKLPLYQEINRIVKEAQLIAEKQFLSRNPDRREDIRAQLAANQRLSQGDVPSAIKIQQKRKQETDQLLQMSK